MRRSRTLHRRRLSTARLDQGAHSFEVQATDAAGNTDATPASRSWTVDTVAPETTIDSGPSGLVNTSAASFGFSSEAGATFECSRDGAAFSSCTSPTEYLSLAEGAHTFEVRATDAAGNTDATPATRSWTVDTIAPQTTIDSGPSGLVNTAAASFGFSSEPGAAFQCSRDGAAFSSCTSPAEYLSLAEGAHTFEVRATDAAGNTDASPASRAWTVDTIAPDTAVDSGPSGLVNTAAASFGFSSEAGAIFQCSLDEATFTTCTSPAEYSSLGQGAHTFQVRATDAAGNTDTSAASRSWTVDTIAPNTSIDSGPNGLVSSAAASLGFSSEGGATFACSLDGEPFSACTSPKEYLNLGQGPHSFEVRATDAAGNTDSSPASRAWTVDTIAPDTAVNSGPSGLVNTAAASFGFSSEAGATFQCSLDSAPFSSCTSPAEYSSLEQGAHTFEVRATDTAGNMDTSPASRSWTVDTIAPESSIDSGPSGLVASAAASFGLSSESGATLECSLDGAAFSTCSSPAEYAGLAQGAHTFEMRATDPAGNTDASPASRSWTVDTIAPDTTIDSGPSGLVNTSSASFAFSSEAGATFECSRDGAAFTTCSSPAAYLSLAEGAHAFEVRAADAAGNTDASPASRTWTVDTIAPQTTIDSGPSGLVNTAAASFGFSSEPGATFQCSRDGAAFSPCTSPKDYATLAEGVHTFEVKATDAAGNTDSTPASRSWSVDTIAPDTTIDSGPSGLVTSAAASLDFSSEAGTTFQCSLDGAAFSPCTSPKDYATLAEGVHTFEVRATDAAGNTDNSPASRSWTVDTIAPQTTIDSGPSGLVDSAAASFGFSSEAGATFECSRDGAAFSSCTSPHEYLGLAEGAHTFEVRATDAAGNTDASPASRSWTVDTIAPDTMIDSGPSGLVNTSAASFAFSSEAGATFECSRDGAAFSSCSSPAEYLSLAEGAHTFEVRATDAAGNTDATPASRSWTVDTIAPQTTIDSGPSGLVNSAVASLGFSSESGASFECSLDSAPFSSCTSPAEYSSLGQGAHTFEVRATDAAGNTDATPASRSWTVDTIAPQTAIDSGPTGLVNTAAASFAFSSEAGATFECSRDGAAFTTCSSPAEYLSLAEGAHTFEVRATDAAGNTDASPAGRAWTVDTIAPQTTIDSGPSGLVNTAAASFAFSSEAGATFQCSIDGAAFTACSSPAEYSSLGQGAHTFEVRATDAAGNTDASPATRSWTVDTIAPDTTIDSGPSGLVNTAAATFAFSSEAGATFECSRDSAAFSSCSSPAEYLSLAEGAHTFEVRATDAAGNTDATPASRSWTVDTIAPDTAIDSGPSGLVNTAAASFGFSSEGGATFKCSLDGAVFSTCSSPAEYLSLAEGAHTFEVRATDAAGNTDTSPASRSWTVDTIAPQTDDRLGPLRRAEH